MFKVTRGYVLAAALTNNTKSDEMPYPVYSSQTKDFGLMGYYWDYLYEDAITWTTDGANAGTVNYRAGKFYCTNVCGVLLSDKINASQMIAEALNNVAKDYVSYVGNPKLMNNVMSDIEIMIPVSPMEQKRISDYFATLDHLITLHRSKCYKVIFIKEIYLGNSVSFLKSHIHLGKRIKIIFHTKVIRLQMRRDLYRKMRNLKMAVLCERLTRGCIISSLQIHLHTILRE